MSKMKTGIKLAAAVFGCVVFATAGVCAMNHGEAKPVKAAELTTEVDILNEYDLGQEFTIPSAIISCGGKTAKATSAFLYFPNGTPHIAESLTLNVLGEYTLEYHAVIDGEKVSATKTFDVNSSAYSLGMNSVLEYKDSLDRIESSSVGGLHLELADQDILTYNEPINIYDYDKDTPLLRMHPYSNGGNGTTYRESLKQVVRLTDCYDPDNFIEFELCWDYSNHLTQTAAVYYRADVAGKKSIGLASVSADKVVKSSIYIGETRYEVCNGQYGAFTNTWQLTDKGVTVYFDPITNCFYAEDRTKIFVSDLDNEELYGENAFKGFTTGEVYISVVAEEYYTGAVNIDISMIAGLQEQELHRDKIFDRKSPMIEIDVPTTDKIYYVAKNEQIAIPKATAYDVNLKGEISVGVYSYYGTNNSRQHSCKNGLFTPTAEGLYTIAYTATDTYGNTATKTITLNCVKMENDEIVSFSMQQASTLLAGQTCELPACEAFSKNGKVKISAYYKLVGEEEVFEITDNAFFVENVGDYEIIYEYSDVFASYRRSYTVSSVPTANVSFDKPVLPNYLIANAPYTFDPVYAYTYESKKPTQQKVEVSLITDGNVETLVDYENVRIPECAKVQFKYSYCGSSVLSDEIPVVNVGFGGGVRMQDYFVGDFEKTADLNAVYYQSNSTGDNSLEFVNVLSLSNFTFSFSIPSEFGQFEALDVILTDYYDRENSVTVSYLKKGDTTYIVCGNSQADVNASFVDKTYKFFYDSRLNAFKDMSSKSVACTQAFTTDKVLLTVRLRNITGDAKLSIIEVGGQVFSNDKIDYFKPVMLIEDDGGVKKVGDVITIKMPTVIDVLCPYSQANLSLKVSKPSKGTVTSDDGVLLGSGCPLNREYTFTLTEDGSYKVRFEYTDAWGNIISGGFTANVSDMEAPTITLNDGYNEGTVVRAKLNSLVTIQGYTAQDNKTATDALSVKCMVYSPSLEHVFLTGNQFAATKAGMYTVYYYVYDTEGNYGVASYQIYVS